MVDDGGRMCVVYKPAGLGVVDGGLPPVYSLCTLTPHPLVPSTSHHPRLYGSLVLPPDRAEPTGRLAVSTLVSLTPLYCHLAHSLYRSLERIDPQQKYEYVVMYHELQNRSLLLTDPYCARLNKLSKATPLRVRFMQVDSHIQHLIDQPWIRIGHAEWKYSMNRLEIFRHEEYDRVMYIDVDTLFVRPIDELFGESLAHADLAAGVDQWNLCAHEQKMNGGVLIGTPSKHLFSVFEELLTTGNTLQACSSGKLYESDQELINCVCGFGDAGFPRRSDVTCQLLPWYTDVMPQSVQCPDYKPERVMIVHYSGPNKPWANWNEREMCDEDSTLGTQNQSLAWFKEPERRHCYEEDTSLFTLWLCYDQHGKLNGPQPDCRLLHLPMTAGQSKHIVSTQGRVAVIFVFKARLQQLATIGRSLQSWKDCYQQSH